MRDLSLQKALDILHGCAIMASGGGGYLERGIEKIERNFSESRKLTMVSVEEIPSDGVVASPYYAGALIPEKERSKVGLKVKYKNETVKAFSLLEDYVGKKFYGSIPIELGGENTAVAMDVAMQFGIRLIDADTAGRAVPEIRQSSYFVKDVPMFPFSVVSKFGEEVLVKEIADYIRAERIIRDLAAMSASVVGVASHPVNGPVLMKSVIPGTISYAGMLGETLRKSSVRGEDPVKELLKSGKGYFLFEGVVESDGEWKEYGGFSTGEHKIRGRNEFKGHSYRIWFRNENLISWRDDKLDVTSPDIITVVDRNTGIPITNPELKEGTNVAVLGFKSDGIWRKGKGLDIMAPRAFGFDIPYIPIEKKYGNLNSA